MAYTKLHQSILTSTIWLEPDATRIVWITLLALSDRHGEISGTVPGIASISRVTLGQCRDAFATFLAPDPDSRTPDDDGRRLTAIDGGWQILNYEKYRLMASKDEQKAKTAARVRRHRERSNVTEKALQKDASNGHVTHDRDIAEAEAEAEAKKERKKSAADAAGAPSEDGSTRAAFDAFVAAARRHPKWPVPNSLTDKRRKALNARVKDAGGLDRFLAVLTKAEASRFICEDMTAWSFDWLLNPTNFAKVAEGNYDDRDNRTKPAKEPMQI